MDKNNFIITQTGTYLETQSKTFQARLDEIQLNSEDEDKIIADTSLKVLRDNTLGLFKIGQVISNVLNWNEEIEGEISEAKKSLLLEQFFYKVDEQEESLSKLKAFITNPQGNTIFSKVLRILDDSPPDQELINHLSSVLKYIVEKNNFSKLFEQHRFALAQIEQLTAQALTVLSDYNNFPKFKLASSMSFGPKVTSDWNLEFVTAYCESKGITNPEQVIRVSHVVGQLQKQGYIEAIKNGEDLCTCEVSKVGRDLLVYIA